MTVPFFISDTHFGHRYVSSLRGFDTPEAHDASLVADWNSVVGPTDPVYLLGDVSFRGVTYTQSIFDQLNGYIYIVPGNHDHKPAMLAKVLGDRGEVLPQLVRIDIPGLEHKVTLCHFPMASWDKSDRGSVHLHGHLHGTDSHHFCAPFRGEGTRINVDVESIISVSGLMAPLHFSHVLASGVRT